MNEPINPINPPSARPGKLKGGANIYLHSFYAIRAFQGRAKTKAKPRIYGADEFNSRTNTIYRACVADDPFAHYALVLVETALADEDKALTQDIRKVRRYLTKHANRVKITEAMSEKPVKFFVHYSNYGFQLVDLLVRFDELCQLLLNGAHCNRIPKTEAKRRMEQASTRMRTLLATALNYRFTGATRQDLRLQTQLSRAAIEKLIESKFIDPRQFSGLDDICQFFEKYDTELTHGPLELGSSQSMANDKIDEGSKAGGEGSKKSAAPQGVADNSDTPLDEGGTSKPKRVVSV